METKSGILKTWAIIYNKTLFELQPESDFIKKPKNVADLIVLIILYNKDCVRLKTFIHFTKPVAVLSLGKLFTLTLHQLVSSAAAT